MNSKRTSVKRRVKATVQGTNDSDWPTRTNRASLPLKALLAFVMTKTDHADQSSDYHKLQRTINIETGDVCACALHDPASSLLQENFVYSMTNFEAQNHLDDSPFTGLAVVKWLKHVNPKRPQVGIPDASGILSWEVAIHCSSDHYYT